MADGAFFDSIMGRTQPARPDLDAIFGLPVGGDHACRPRWASRRPARGAVAFRVPEGRAFAEVQGEVEALLAALREAQRSRSRATSTATPGWCSRPTPPDVAGLVTNLHAVNLHAPGHRIRVRSCCARWSASAVRRRARSAWSTCSSRARSTRSPLPRTASQTRDTMLELQVRDLVRDDLPVEKELSRWFPIWGAPGL